MRNLSGIYIRVKRNDQWTEICFEELTKEEQTRFLDTKSVAYIKNLCILLQQTSLFFEILLIFRGLIPNNIFYIFN